VACPQAGGRLCTRRPRVSTNRRGPLESMASAAHGAQCAGSMPLPAGRPRLKRNGHSSGNLSEDGRSPLPSIRTKCRRSSASNAGSSSAAKCPPRSKRVHRTTLYLKDNRHHVMGRVGPHAPGGRAGGRALLRRRMRRACARLRCVCRPGSAVPRARTHGRACVRARMGVRACARAWACVRARARPLSRTHAPPTSAQAHSARRGTAPPPWAHAHTCGKCPAHTAL
jgi:hypothetical protein